jgi:hypothetical protein
LARLYVDSAARAEFLCDRARAVSAAGLTESERTSVVGLDAGALELAARSFTHKHLLAQRRRARRPLSDRWLWFRRALSWLRGA